MQLKKRLKHWGQLPTTIWRIDFLPLLKQGEEVKDSIKPGMPRDEFRQRVIDRLKARREEMKNNEEF